MPTSIYFLPDAKDRYAEIAMSFRALNSKGRRLLEMLLARGDHSVAERVREMMSASSSAEDSIDMFLESLPSSLNRAIRGIDRRKDVERVRSIGSAIARIEAIQHATAEVYGVSVEDMIRSGKDQLRKIPRYVAMYIAKESGCSWNVIGELFNRSRAAAIRAARNGKNIHDKDAALMAAIRWRADQICEKREGCVN